MERTLVSALDGLFGGRYGVIVAFIIIVVLAAMLVESLGLDKQIRDFWRKGLRPRRRKSRRLRR